MTLRKFTDQTQYTGEPGAKLYKNGAIRFNDIAGRVWFNNVDYVELFVDDNGNDLGVKPANATKEGTYKFSPDGEHGGHVAVRSVLSHYGIWHEQMDESIAVPVRWDEDKEMVVVDLTEPVKRWGDRYRADNR